MIEREKEELPASRNEKSCLLKIICRNYLPLSIEIGWIKVDNKLANWAKIHMKDEDLKAKKGCVIARIVFHEDRNGEKRGHATLWSPSKTR